MKTRRKHSLKKTLGTGGTIIIYLISLFGAIKDPSLIPQILGVLVVMVLGFFGIKKYGAKLATEEQ